MKCWRCDKEAQHLTNGLHETVSLHDGKEVILAVLPKLAAYPLTDRPMLCMCCWAEVVGKLKDNLLDKIKEVMK